MPSPLEPLDIESRRVETPLRSRVDWCLIALGLVILATCLEFRVTGDGDQRFRDLQALVEHGKISPEPYSLVGPLGATPLYLVGRAMQHTRDWVARYNFVLFGAGLVLLYRLVSRVDRSASRSLVLILLAASMFPHHLRDFYGEMFTAVLASGGIVAIGLAGSTWGWVGLVLAVANTAAGLAGLVLVAASEVWRRRRLRYLLAVAAALALVLAENAIRRGNAFASGYEHSQGFQTVLPYSGREGFSYPFAFGVLSILFSFGKGLLLYAPGLLLPLRGPLATPQRLLLLFTAGLVLVYAQWWAWYGGWFWGPRFFLIASIPAAMALATHTSHPSPRPMLNVLVLVCLAWSTWVAINGVVFELYGLDTCFDNNKYQWEFLCWYVPELSPLFRPFVDMKPLSSTDLAIVAYCAAVLAWLAAPTLAALAAQSKTIAAALRDRWARGPRLRF